MLFPWISFPMTDAPAKCAGKGEKKECTHVKRAAVWSALGGKQLLAPMGRPCAGARAGRGAKQRLTITGPAAAAAAPLPLNKLAVGPSIALLRLVDLVRASGTTAVKPIHTLPGMQGTAAGRN